MSSTRQHCLLSPALGLLRLFSWLAALLLITAPEVSATKLRIDKSECVAQTIMKPQSLVTIAFVASPFRGAESYFDIQVTDPGGHVIFSKEEQETAELSFKTQLVGEHKVCFTVSKNNSGLSSGIASPRVSKKTREIVFDVTVGETWSEDRVKTEHLDDLMEDVSDLKTLVQKLRSEIRYLKFREIRHRKTVKSTANRVIRYALGKMIVIIVIAIAQPVIIAIFFQRQFKF